jgi:putative phosphonate metabolism protein
VPRYAVYYAPARGSALAEFGADWLGRDPWTGERRGQPAIPDIDPGRLHEITASPRLYGFHGTLKAPFEPAQGVNGEAIEQAVRALAAEWRAFEIDLQLGSIDGFLALVPARRSPELGALAAACVVALDHLRAPLSESELARRRRSGLSPQQDAYLRRYGYPHIFEFFGFHLTLTERLAEPESTRLRRVLEPMVGPFCREPLPIDALTLFAQAHRAAPFEVAGRFPLRP